MKQKAFVWDSGSIMEIKNEKSKPHNNNKKTGQMTMKYDNLAFSQIKVCL